MKPVRVKSGIIGHVEDSFPPVEPGNVPLPYERIGGSEFVTSRWKLRPEEVGRIIEGHDITVTLRVPVGTQHPTITVAVGVVPVGSGPEDGYMECAPLTVRKNAVRTSFVATSAEETKFLLTQQLSDDVEELLDAAEQTTEEQLRAQHEREETA